MAWAIRFMRTATIDPNPELRRTPYEIRFAHRRAILATFHQYTRTMFEQDHYYTLIGIVTDRNEWIPFWSLYPAPIAHEAYSAMLRVPPNERWQRTHAWILSEWIYQWEWPLTAIRSERGLECVGGSIDQLTVHPNHLWRVMCRIATEQTIEPDSLPWQVLKRSPFGFTDAYQPPSRSVAIALEPPRDLLTFDTTLFRKRPKPCQAVLIYALHF